VVLFFTFLISKQFSPELTLSLSLSGKFNLADFNLSQQIKKKPPVNPPVSKTQPKLPQLKPVKTN
jgi:hypothetical protein